MLGLLILAAALPAQQRTVPLLVHARVVQSCTISQAGARCHGARDRPPVVMREGNRIVYRF